MTIADQLQQKLEDMTRSERKVAAYFLGHRQEFALNTLECIAADVGVSTTSVIRFCRCLGFSGFKPFQQMLREDFLPPSLPDKLQRIDKDALLMQTLQQDIRCIQETFENIPFSALSTATAQIIDAQRIFTFGMKESYALAHYACTRLQSVRKDVSILDAGYNGDVEPLLSLTGNDVCLVFLFHRYTRQTLQLLPLIKAQGARVILVTSAPCDEVAPLADTLLCCQVDAKGIKNSAVAPICLTDYLCNAAAVLSGEDALLHMKQAEALFHASATVAG